MTFSVSDRIEKFRVRHGPMASDETYGANGQFLVKSIKFPRAILVQISDGGGWEHLSAAFQDRCPTWEEMSALKEMFWDSNDLVVQYHPIKSEYVNNHPYCLHLWRRAGTNDFCERPPVEMIGIR